MQALALGNIGEVQTPHQHEYTFKTNYEARSGINQTFFHLLLYRLTPDNLKDQAARLLAVYTTEMWLMCGSSGSWQKVAGGRAATVWAELGRRSCTDVSGRERKREDSTVCSKHLRFKSKFRLPSRLRTQEEGVSFAASQ